MDRSKELEILKILNFHESKFDAIFGYTNDSLDVIEIGPNKIKSIPKNLFEGLDTIKALWIYENPIEKLDEEIFANLKNLETVWIYKTKITHFQSNSTIIKK